MDVLDNVITVVKLEKTVMCNRTIYEQGSEHQYRAQ
jgi:hypothetical protein